MHPSPRSRRHARRLAVFLAALLLTLNAACIPEDPGGVPYATSKDPNDAPDNLPGVAGRVIDAATGLPVAGALITSSPASEAVLSRDDGAYLLALNLKPGSLRVQATADGYEPTTISIFVTQQKTHAADILLFRPGQRPAVYITPRLLAFEPDRHRLAAQLHNTSPDVAAWTFEDLPPWLRMEPAEGTLQPGERAQVVASLDPEQDLPAVINPGDLDAVLANARVRTRGAGADPFSIRVRLAREDRVGGVWLNPQRGDLEEDNPLELPLDQPQDLALRIDVEGRPLVGATVNLLLTRDDGDVALNAAQITDADGVARWSFTPSRPGLLRATARLTALPDAELPTRRFRVGDDTHQGGVASARDSRIEVNPTRLPTTERATVRVQVRDALGVPLAGIQVQLDSDDTLDITQPPATDEDGWAEGSVNSPTPLTTRIGATLDPGGLDLPLNERVAVTFYDPQDPAAEIILDPIDGDGVVIGVADGATGACFAFTLQRPDGTPQAGVNVAVSSNPPGFTTQVTTDDQGRAQVCPTSDTPGEVTYTLDTGDDTTTVTVRYAPEDDTPRTPAWTWTWQLDPTGLFADLDPDTHATACLILTDADTGAPLPGLDVTFTATAADPGGPTLTPGGSATDATGTLCADLDSSLPGPKTLRASFALDGQDYATEPLRARFLTPPPTVLVSPQPDTRGCGDIAYAIQHPLASPARLIVEQRPDSASPWRPLTLAPAAAPQHQGLHSLDTAAAPGGAPHTLRWNALADQPGRHLPDAQLRLRACVDDACSEPVEVSAPVANHTRFTSPREVALHDNPFDTLLRLRDVAVGDFNGDGRQDIAVLAMVRLITNATRERVLFLYGQPGDTFAADFIEVTSAAQAFTAADFDRDGRDDLAIIENGAAPLHIHLSSQSFADTPLNQGFSSANEFVTDLAAGDVNNDGNIDLLTVTQARGYYLRNLGAGTFDTQVGPGAPTAALQNAEARFNDTRLIDLNADGRLDLLTFFRDSNLASFALGSQTSAGSFPTSGVIAAVPTLTRELLPADLDGDNRPELLAVSPTGVQVLRSASRNGSLIWTLDTSSAYTLAGANLRAAVGDTNVDARPDLLLLGDINAAQTGLQLLPGLDTTLPLQAEPPQPGPQPGDLPPLLADLDGDGHPDLITFELRSLGLPSVLHITPGQRPTSCAPNLNAPRAAITPDLPDRLFAGDLDGDHLIDVAAARGGDLLLHRALGDGALDLNAWAPLTTQLTELRATFAVDLDRDGLIDLLVAGAAGAAGRWEVHPGAATNAPALPTGDATDAPIQHALLADLNQDGDLDLLTADEAGDLAWHPGQGTTFAAHISLPLTTSSPPVALDFNGDGLLDIAASTPQGIQLLVGQGGGAFLPADDTLPGSGAIAAADLDGDGFDDLIHLDAPQRALRVFLGADPEHIARSTPLDAPEADLTGATLHLRPDDAGAWTLDLLTDDSILSADALPDGTFTPPQRWALPPTDRVTLADLHAQGRPHLVYAVDLPSGPRLVSVYPTPGLPVAATEALDLGFTPAAAALEDLNYDGTLDALLLDDAGSLHLVANLAAEAPNVGAPLPFDLSGVTRLLLARLDTDLYTDLVALDTQNNQAIALLNDRDGALPTSSTWTPTAGASLTDLAIADTNRDRRPDVVVLDENGTLTAAALNRFGFTGAETILGDTDRSGLLRVAFARLTEDAYPDPILLSNALNAVTFALNTTGTLNPSADAATPLEPAARLLLDNLAGDPTPELLVLGADQQPHVAQLGLTPEACAAAAAGPAPCLLDTLTLNTHAPVTDLALFDLDRDGRRDIIASLEDGTLTVFLSGPTFEDLGATAREYLPHAAGPIALGHPDRDGRPNLLLADPDSQRLLNLPAR